MCVCVYIYILYIYIYDGYDYSLLAGGLGRYVPHSEELKSFLPSQSGSVCCPFCEFCVA